MLLLVLLSMAAALVLGQDQPRIAHYERHTMKLECPSRAVCADVYSFHRYGRPERRALYNCRCPGQTTRCPLDESRMLHETVKHRLYFCEPLAAIPDCSDTDTEQVAEEIIRNSPVFEYNTYVQVKCVCPRHREPIIPEPGHIERAVTWYNSRQDVPRNIYYQSYVCATRTRQYFDTYRPDQRRHSRK